MYADCCRIGSQFGTKKEGCVMLFKRLIGLALQARWPSAPRRPILWFASRHPVL
jgi:hypothetical protein